MLGRLLAPLSVKHFFHHIAKVMDLDADRSLLRAARRLVVPADPPPVDGEIFPALAPLQVSGLAGKKRMQLRRIEDRCLMIHPLAYEEFKGIRLYEQFVDRRQWLDFIRRGHAAARRGLEDLARRSET